MPQVRTTQRGLSAAATFCTSRHSMTESPAGPNPGFVLMLTVLLSLLFNSASAHPSIRLATIGPRPRLPASIEYALSYISFPVKASDWTLGQSVSALITINDVVSGKPISDAEATALLRKPCRVKISLSGAQSKAPACMSYNPATNRFSSNFKLASTGVGRVTVTIDVLYPNSTKTMVRRTRNVWISNWWIKLRKLLKL
jgi:hypothetical protein